MAPGHRKVSSSTAKDSKKGSSAGASFHTSAQKSGKVTGGDAVMGQGDAAGAAGKQTSRTAGRKRIRSESPSCASETIESHHSDGTPASPIASDGGTPRGEDAQEQCSSPTLDWIPFTPPPTTVQPKPQVKPESRRNRAADAALAHKQLVEGCKTPEEFVVKVVYSAIPGMFRQWVDKSPPQDAPQTVWSEFVRARRAMSDASIAWWMKEVFGGALPIALSLVGAQHTGITDQDYSVDARVKRSFWFMCFIIAATENDNMGSNRDIAFVKQVYRATVEDFMIPAPGTDKERGGKEESQTGPACGTIGQLHHPGTCQAVAQPTGN
jgi:hypothetical protein